MTTIAWYSRIALVCLFVLFAGAIGAERKHVTLPMDFRSPSVNGHSCYGHLTARFAPQQPFAAASGIGRVGWKWVIPDLPGCDADA